MRRLFLILVLFWLVFACRGQTPATGTNSLFSNITGAVNGLLTHTNWYGGAYGLYAPGLKKKWGAGTAEVYPLSQYVETGLRLDYVDGGFYMPSGSATFQLPIPLGQQLELIPFTYAGIGIPLAGANLAGFTLPGQPPKENNGQPTAILGVGLTAVVWRRGHPSAHFWQLDSVLLIADVEKWTGFENVQARFGLFGNKKF